MCFSSEITQREIFFTFARIFVYFTMLENIVNVFYFYNTVYSYLTHS